MPRQIKSKLHAVLTGGMLSPSSSLARSKGRRVCTIALQAYLGHENIQHTARHIELAATLFKDFWR
jgi:hypothetical protein